MPVIPPFVSQESYGNAQAAPLEPTRPLDTLARADTALATGFGQVSQQFAEVWGHLRSSQIGVDSASVMSDATKRLADLKDGFMNDPDPATVPARFEKASQDFQSQTLQAIGDPAVSARVNGLLTHQLTSAYVEISHQATAQNITQQQGKVIQAGGVQALALGQAKSDDERTIALHTMNDSLDSAVASGLIHAQDRQKIFSGWIKDAVVLQSVKDAAGAQQLLTAHLAEMTPQDAATVALHLEPRLERQQAEGAAAGAIGAGAGLDSRAQAVHDEFVRQGTPDDEAWAWAANSLHESAGTPATRPGDGGASHGLMQWRDSRLTDFQNQNGGQLPENSSLAANVKFALWEKANTEAKAGAAIDAASGPAEKAKAISAAFLRPAAKQQNMDERSATATRLASLAGGYQVPDVGAQLATVRANTADMPLRVQQHAEALVLENYHHATAAIAGDKAELGRQVGDLQAAYGAGLTDTEIPEQKIRSLYPADQADRMVQGLQITRTAGDYYKAMAYATPDQEQAARAALAVPGSMSAEQVRRSGKGRLAAPALPASDGSAAPEDPELAHLRLQVAAKLDQLLDAKHKAVAADPVAYAASSPAMQAATKALDPQDPATPAALIDKSQDAQRALGLADNQVRTLSNAQISDIVTKLHSVDPAKGDMGAQLNGLAQQFGTHWPAAFADLVKVGKISPDYQLLAAMDAPQQAAGRQDFQRALQYRDQKGGLEKLAQDAPPDAVRTINQNLDATIDPFRHTVAFNQGGPGLVNSVRDGVKTLALFKAMQGQDATTALASAYDQIIGQKYDIDGTMRVPKGMLGPVSQAGDRVQQGLTLADIAPVPGNPNLTPAERGDIMLRAAKNGVWVPNSGDDGLQLMAKLREGSVIPVRRRDGSPVEIKFAALPSDTAPPLPERQQLQMVP